MYKNLKLRVVTLLKTGVIASLNTELKLNGEKLDCCDVLGLFIALEARKKYESDIWPYIRTLPNSHDTVLEFWPDKYDQFITDRILQNKLNSQADFEARFNKIKQNYNSQHLETRVTRDEFHFAVASVFTRYLGAEYTGTAPEWFDNTVGCGAVAPVFDMLNHQTSPNCD